jgi:copper chaperone
MEKRTFKVTGMTCEHCVMHVTKALESVEGVKSAKVSLKKNEATVKFDETATTEAMVAAVQGAGYQLSI